MKICKKCFKPIRYSQKDGKIIVLNDASGGGIHDYDKCSKDRVIWFRENGTFHTATRKFKNHFGPQTVTTEWLEWNGFKLNLYEGPFLAYPH